MLYYRIPSSYFYERDSSNTGQAKPKSKWYFPQYPNARLAVNISFPTVYLVFLRMTQITSFETVEHVVERQIIPVCTLLSSSPVLHNKTSPLYSPEHTGKKNKPNLSLIHSVVVVFHISHRILLEHRCSIVKDTIKWVSGVLKEKTKTISVAVPKRAGLPVWAILLDNINLKILKSQQSIERLVFFNIAYFSIYTEQIYKKLYLLDPDTGQLVLVQHCLYVQPLIGIKRLIQKIPDMYYCLNKRHHNVFVVVTYFSTLCTKRQETPLI